MPRILHKLPIPEKDTHVHLGQERIRLKAYEILVWVSLASRPVMDPSRLPRFPALLDTGHTHNFSIQEEHLRRWAGLSRNVLSLGFGEVRHLGRTYPLFAASLWIHSNNPGTWDERPGALPHNVELPGGMLVYPSGSRFPRLPLLGLRAIVHNELRLVVDGERGRVSLRTRRWWWPFG